MPEKNYAGSGAPLNLEGNEMDMNIGGLPTGVLKHITQLRKECARMRVQRNRARAEVGSLRLTVAHLRAENEQLRGADQ